MRGNEYTVSLEPVQLLRGFQQHSGQIGRLLIPLEYKGISSYLRGGSAMKSKLLLCFCAVILALCFYGCAQEQQTDDPLCFSLNESYVPQQGGLSFLPWFTSLEEAKEILKLDSLAQGDYKLWGEGNVRFLSLYNVKLQEWRYPMELRLTFVQDPPVGQESGYLLCKYVFEISTAEGLPVQTGDDWLKVPAATQQLILANCKEDQLAWLKQADEKYRSLLDDANRDMFVKMMEEDGSIQSIYYRFPGEAEATKIRICCESRMLQCQVWDAFSRESP